MSRLLDRLAGVRPLSRRAGVRAVTGSVGAGLVAQTVLIVSGVLAARGLGVEDRGYFALLVLWPAGLSVVAAFGVPDALIYHVARAPQAWRSAVKQIQPLVLGQAVTFVAAHALVAWLIFAGQPGEVQSAALVTLPSIPLMLAQRYALSILQGAGSFRAFNACRVLQPTLYSAGLAAMFVTIGMDLLSVTVTWLASLAVSAGATLVAALRVPSSDQDLSPLGRRSLLAFGGKSLLGSSSPAETFRLDQAVVGLLLSPEALGIYVVALAFTNLPRFVAQSVGLVAFPSIAGAAGFRRRSQFWRFVGLATALAAPVALLLALATPWLVPLLFGEGFTAAIGAARILLLAALLRSISRAFGDGLRGLGMPGVSSVAEVVSFVALGIALLVLAPSLGVNGAAWAMVAAGATSLVATVGLAHLAHRGSAADSSELSGASQTSHQKAGSADHIQQGPGPLEPGGRAGGDHE